MISFKGCGSYKEWDTSSMWIGLQIKTLGRFIIMVNLDHQLSWIEKPVGEW